LDIAILHLTTATLRLVLVVWWWEIDLRPVTWKRLEKLKRLKRTERVV